MSETDRNKPVEYYLEKWNPSGSEDRRLNDLRDVFDSWLDQIPEDIQPVVHGLLEGLCYYTHDSANRLLRDLHLELCKKYHIKDDDTIYAFITSKDSRSNSSNDYWTEYKFINNIDSELCITNPDILEEEYWEYINNVVFIDDCSGTGKTFYEYICKRKDRYKGKKIYFIAIHMMKEAKEKISRVLKGLSVTIISSETQEKAFTPRFFESEAKAEEAKKVISEVSKSFGIHRDHILGFANSESLMAFYNNTPNNTLGIIRFDTETYSSLFPRKRSFTPEWKKLGRKKKAREASNYNAKL